jgi:hypothetical protein
VKAKETIEYKIEKKETPFGYGLIHAGKQIAHESITCLLYLICDENP